MNDMILFTGQSGSGKTTLAKLVSQKGYYRLGEREILHRLAGQRGYPRTRYWLEAEGPGSLVTAARTETISILNKISIYTGVILDGIYDQELPDLIRKRFDQNRLLLVNIFANDRLRLERVSRRLGVIDDAIVLRELSLIDDYKSFAGIAQVMAQADMTIKNEGSLDEVYQDLSQQLKLERLGRGVSGERG